MELVRIIFNTALNMVIQLWTACLNSWSIFGTFILSFAVLKKVVRTFNKLKG